MLVIAGCDRREPPASSATKSEQSEKGDEARPARTDATADQNDAGNVATLVSTVAAESTRDGMPPEPVEVDSAATIHEPVPSRLLVMLSGGPLLVDIFLTIDGKDWNDPASNAANTSSGRYGDGRGKSLLLDSSRSRYYEPRWHSRVWQLLEADADGVLSAEEWQAAPARLLARDADDDRIIYPQDLDTLRDQLRSAEGLATTMRSEAGLHAARLVSADADWQLISAILCDFYASGQPLAHDSFPQMAGLFAELDADASGRLKTTELAELANRPAHLTLATVFSSDSSAAGASARLDVKELDEEFVHVMHVSADRLAIMAGDEGLDLSIHDRSGMAEMAARPRMNEEVQRDTLRISVHNRGDSVFAQLDADHDGRLGEREIAYAAQQFQSLDANEDGRLSAGEVSGRMTVDLVRGNLPAGEARYNLSRSRPASGDFSPPDWFVHGDFNGDGHISRREFVGTLDQFGQLDLNDDGFISAAEAAVVEVN
jgi:hypothetical protein